MAKLGPKQCRMLAWTATSRFGSAKRALIHHGRDWTDRMPPIVEAMLSLPVSLVTIDGEAVVCDATALPTSMPYGRHWLARGGGRGGGFLCFLFFCVGGWGW